MEKKNILIGVCGGISSYKTCRLVRLFVKDTFKVKVMMTPSAAKFVAPLTFQTISQNPVYVEMFNPPARDFAEHISLAQWADVCVIAPLSANTLSKIALGICDNLLTTVVCALADKTQVVLAPAMNECMWKNPIVQGNVERLKKYKKYTVLEPEDGQLACGTYGQGRMPEAQGIYEQVIAILKK